MKRYKYIIALGLYIVLAMASTNSVDAATKPRFKQWIAPLECTREEVVNGVNQTYILTPEECYDFLNPEPPPVDPTDPSKPTTPDDKTPGYLDIPFLTDGNLDDSFQWQGKQLIQFPQSNYGIRPTDKVKPACESKPFSTCSPLWFVLIISGLGAALVYVIVSKMRRDRRST